MGQCANATVDTVNDIDIAIAILSNVAGSISGQSVVEPVDSEFEKCSPLAIWLVVEVDALSSVIGLKVLSNCLLNDFARDRWGVTEIPAPRDICTFGETNAGRLSDV